MITGGLVVDLLIAIWGRRLSLIISCSFVMLCSCCHLALLSKVRTMITRSSGVWRRVLTEELASVKGLCRIRCFYIMFLDVVYLD